MLLVKTYRAKDYWLVFIIFYMLIWAFIEPYIINIGRNIFILTFITLFYNKPLPNIENQKREDVE